MRIHPAPATLRVSTRNFHTMFWHWLIAAVAIGITSFVIPGARVGVFSALGAAVVLGLLNIFIKPLILILTLPVNILTLGLFTIVINAALIMLAAAVVPGFEIKGFGSALLFAIVLTLVNIILK